MRPFTFARVNDVTAAVGSYQPEAIAEGQASVHAAQQYLAGGTTLVDLMKLDVMRPATVIDINALTNGDAGKISLSDKGLRLGALVRMSQAAEHDAVKSNFPVIAQSLQLAASAQLRNMASLGGNVLQRTRCSYFRDTSYAACNKREPGSGCAAMDGFNRSHAVLGTSEDCIATYPGDFAQALIALDATVDIAGPRANRTIPFAQLHRAPADRPQIETTLAPGELITAFNIPPAPFAKRSLYLKIRDRQSYEFALASVAVALDLDGEKVRDIRLALGGVATLPWRAREAEAILKGKPLDDGTLDDAADKAFEKVDAREHNAFKVKLGKAAMVRAVKQAAALSI